MLANPLTVAHASRRFLKKPHRNILCHLKGLIWKLVAVLVEIRSAQGSFLAA